MTRWVTSQRVILFERLLAEFAEWDGVKREVSAKLMDNR
jgi:hypothetical protein